MEYNKWQYNTTCPVIKYEGPDDVDKINEIMGQLTSGEHIECDDDIYSFHIDHTLKTTVICPGDYLVYLPIVDRFVIVDKDRFGNMGFYPL